MPIKIPTIEELLALQNDSLQTYVLSARLIINFDAKLESYKIIDNLRDVMVVIPKIIFEKNLQHYKNILHLALSELPFTDDDICLLQHGREFYFTEEIA